MTPNIAWLDRVLCVRWVTNGVDFASIYGHSGARVYPLPPTRRQFLHGCHQWFVGVFADYLGYKIWNQKGVSKLPTP